MAANLVLSTAGPVSDLTASQSMPGKLLELWKCQVKLYLSLMMTRENGNLTKRVLLIMKEGLARVEKHRSN